MTHTQHHPQAHLQPHPHPLPIYHPAPVVRPHLPSPAQSNRIPGRSGTFPFNAKTPAVQLAGQIGQIGMELRNLNQTGGSSSTRAVLHAQAVIPQINAELARIASGKASAGRLHQLESMLKVDLLEIEGYHLHTSAAGLPVR